MNAKKLRLLLKKNHNLQTGLVGFVAIVAMIAIFSSIQTNLTGAYQSMLSDRQRAGENIVGFYAYLTPEMAQTLEQFNIIVSQGQLALTTSHGKEIVSETRKVFVSREALTYLESRGFKVENEYIVFNYT